MSWEEQGCCWDYRSPDHQVAYASYYSDCGVHVSEPQKITHTTTCYIICPDGERDCESRLGLIFWMLIAFLVVMVCSIVASVCSKCKQRRRAAALRRNMEERGVRNENSIIVGQVHEEGSELEKQLINPTFVAQGTPGD